MSVAISSSRPEAKTLVRTAFGSTGYRFGRIVYILRRSYKQHWLYSASNTIVEFYRVSDVGSDVRRLNGIERDVRYVGVKIGMTSGFALSTGAFLMSRPFFLAVNSQLG